MEQVPSWIYMAVFALCSFCSVVSAIFAFHFGYYVARDKFGGDS